MTDYIRGMEGRTRILPMQQANENRWHRAEVMFQVFSLSETYEVTVNVFSTLNGWTVHV